MAAMMKEKMTPGPAKFRATMPATRYMPVPTQLPTPSEVRSSVVRQRCAAVGAALAQVCCCRGCPPHHREVITAGTASAGVERASIKCLPESTDTHLLLPRATRRHLLTMLRKGSPHAHSADLAR